MKITIFFGIWLCSPLEVKGLNVSLAFLNLIERKWFLIVETNITSMIALTAVIIKCRCVLATVTQTPWKRFRKNTTLDLLKLVWNCSYLFKRLVWVNHSYERLSHSLKERKNSPSCPGVTFCDHLWKLLLWRRHIEMNEACCW